MKLMRFPVVGSSATPSRFALATTRKQVLDPMKQKFPAFRQIDQNTI